jgi:hypothetical protein
VDANYSVAALETLYDLIADPTPVICLGPDKNYGDRCILEFVVNHTLEREVALFFGFLPDGSVEIAG